MYSIMKLSCFTVMESLVFTFQFSFRRCAALSEKIPYADLGNGCAGLAYAQRSFVNCGTYLRDFAASCPSFSRSSSIEIK